MNLQKEKNGWSEYKMFTVYVCFFLCEKTPITSPETNIDFSVILKSTGPCKISPLNPQVFSDHSPEN